MTVGNDGVDGTKGEMCVVLRYELWDEQSWEKDVRERRHEIGCKDWILFTPRSTLEIWWIFKSPRVGIYVMWKYTGVPFYCTLTNLADFWWFLARMPRGLKYLTFIFIDAWNCCCTCMYYIVFVLGTLCPSHVMSLFDVSYLGKTQRSTEHVLFDAWNCCCLYNTVFVLRLLCRCLMSLILGKPKEVLNMYCLMHEIVAVCIIQFLSFACYVAVWCLLSWENPKKYWTCIVWCMKLLLYV